MTVAVIEQFRVLYGMWHTVLLKPRMSSTSIFRQKKKDWLTFTRTNISRARCRIEVVGLSASLSSTALIVSTPAHYLGHPVLVKNKLFIFCARKTIIYNRDMINIDTLYAIITIIHVLEMYAYYTRFLVFNLYSC